MIEVRADVAVIGAGPAGLSAATAAAQTGASVHLIDAMPSGGGQYWMQPSLLASQNGVAHGQRTQRTASHGQIAQGAGAIAAARRAGVTFSLGADVWAIFPGHTICAIGPSGAFNVRARTIVVASGANDRVVPFPGWTLPGVMTAGAAQRLAKLDGVPAGRRVVVAGSGPFLLAVASAVQSAGAQLAAFVEARVPRAALVGHIARYPGRWSETAALLGAVARGGTRRRFGWVVIEALGHERVDAVRIAPVMDGTMIDRSRSKIIDGIDALIIGWGFRPAIELTALLRCRHAFDDARGGWYCETDPHTGQTSIDGVFAAGEVTGVAGALPAQLGGAAAGRAAAAAAGFSLRRTARRERVDRDRLLRARTFAAGLNACFAPPAAIHTLAADDTIVCRCEEVTRGEICAAVVDGARTVSGVKRLTRAGMGACQGRICGWAVANTIASGTGAGAATAGFNAPRIPLRPVPLALIAGALTNEPYLEFGKVDPKHDGAGLV